MPVHFVNLHTSLIERLRQHSEACLDLFAEDYFVCEYGTFLNARTVLWLLDCIDQKQLFEVETNYLYQPPAQKVIATPNSFRVTTFVEDLLAICQLFMISVVDDGLKIDFDLDRNWLIHSYLAGELQNIDSYLIPREMSL